MFVFGLILIHILILFNLRFTAWPEIISFPYFFNNGFNLYGDMVHAYSPLLTLVLAAIYKIFGYRLIVVQIFTWLGIVVSDILIFRIVKKATHKYTFALLALIFYVVTQPFLDGNMLWFDTALTLPVLFALYYRENLFLSGIFLAIALLTKQTALAYIGAFLVYLIFSKVGFKKILLFLIPTVISLLLFLLWLEFTGSLADFYNWNFYYPSIFWTKYPSYEILSLTKRELFGVFLILLPPGIFLFTKFRKIVLDKNLVLFFLFLGAGILAVYPRFSFYHFQPALAITAVLFGVSLTHLKKIPFLVLYLLFLVFLISVPGIKVNWQKETRFWGRSEVELAGDIRKEVGENETVYLLGPHSAFYVLSGRLPPKPWLDNYGWYFEIPGIQEKTISSWDKNPPAVIIIQDPNPGRWYEIGVYQPKKIIEWVKAKYYREREIKSGLWLWRIKK